MKVISVVGARPQFIKAAPVCRALRETPRGDPRALGAALRLRDVGRLLRASSASPSPTSTWRSGRAATASRPARCSACSRTLYLEQQPDCVLVYGDTNTTLAGALAAAKLAHPGRARRGRAALLRARHARGDQPRADGPRQHACCCCPTRRGGGQPRRRGHHRGRRAGRRRACSTPRGSSPRREDAAPVLEQHGVERGRLLPGHGPPGGEQRRPRAAGVDHRGLRDGSTGRSLWPIHPRTRANLERFGLAARLAEAAERDRGRSRSPT